MSEMLERCARAAWCVQLGVYDDGPHLDRAWSEANRARFQNIARGVLAELAKPTPEMIAAAWGIVGPAKKVSGIARLGPGLGVREIFTAMITAAQGAGG